SRHDISASSPPNWRLGWAWALGMSRHYNQQEKDRSDCGCSSRPGSFGRNGSLAHRKRKLTKLPHHSTGNCVRSRLMNQHAPVATALCAVENVHHQRTREAPQGRGYKTTSSASCWFGLLRRRQPGGFPAFEAAGHGPDVFVAHFLQALGGERGT